MLHHPILELNENILGSSSSKAVSHFGQVLFREKSLFSPTVKESFLGCPFPIKRPS